MSPEANIAACELCAEPKRGRYNRTCVGCAVRLLRTAPAGAPRRAMYSHLMMFCDDDQIEAIRAAAEAEGLTRAAA